MKNIITVLLLSVSSNVALAAPPAGIPKSIICEGKSADPFSQIELFNNGRFWTHDPPLGWTVNFFIEKTNGAEKYDLVWTDVPTRGVDPLEKNYIFKSVLGDIASVKLFYKSTSELEPQVSVVFPLSGEEFAFVDKGDCVLVRK